VAAYGEDVPGVKQTEPRAIIVAHGVKAFEKLRFRPMYAEANMGHPSRTNDCGWEIKVGEWLRDQGKCFRIGLFPRGHRFSGPSLCPSFASKEPP
jgi:hypothetical protein